jgi:hypothetical protein
MITPNERKLTAWRIVKPLIKPLVPLCYNVFPPSRNLKRYWNTFGRMPNVIRPRTFNERIQRKILSDRLLEVARRLSAGTDFLRVDLYNINGRVVFSELTNYPFGGRAEFEPPKWDLKLGSYWR